MNLCTHESYPRRVRRMSRRVLRGFSPQEFATARIRAGLSVSDLARIANVAVSTIHHWEAGTRSPQIDILANVMTVLHAPIESVVLIPTNHRYPSDWRAMKGLTQPQLAAAAHMPTATIQRIERADYPLSDKNAQTIANVLSISVEEYKAAYQRARKRPAGTPP
ncbi:helix-turn-helix transcriptional regulator [Mycobacterium avium]|nr:helix-turn-helix transcriptional regulator [Mycobacterium avium]